MSFEDKIKQAELDKLIAETELARSERNRIDSEKEQAEKPFYVKLNFLKTVIAGFVGGLAILGVFQNIIEPTYKKDIIQKELEIALKEKLIFELNDSVQSAKDSIQNLNLRNTEVLAKIESKTAENSRLIDSLNGYDEKLKSRERNILLQKRRTFEIINDQLKYLKNLNKENAIHVQSIYFEYDKAVLQENQAKQLQSVIKFLIDNKSDNFSIEVNGYSYVDGPSAYNLKLSERRASVVSDYLISNGLPPDRIVTKGFGEVDIHPIIIKDLDRNIGRKLYELKTVVQVYLTY